MATLTTPPLYMPRFARYAAFATAGNVETTHEMERKHVLQVLFFHLMKTFQDHRLKCDDFWVFGDQEALKGSVTG